MDKLLKSCSQGRFNAHIQIKDGSNYVHKEDSMLIPFKRKHKKEKKNTEIT
jgi:hypothetical protein